MPEPALLRALHPGPLQTEQRLSDEGEVIGRDGRVAGIVLHGPRVSRRHCWIGPCAAGPWIVKDLGSTNGVFVNGEPVDEEHTLSSHDVIGLGRSRAADFEFVSGDHDDALRTRTLKGNGPWLIGRDLGADLSLPADPVVSLHHAQLDFQSGELIIKDLGSRNGTWVDGKRIRRAPLSANQRIVIGNHELELCTIGNAKPAFTVRTTQRAVGLKASCLALTSDQDAVDFEVSPGGLKILDARSIGSAERLIEVISGQHRPHSGTITFSDPALDQHPGYRHDCLGATSNDVEPGRRQTMSEWMNEQARLALAGDLSPERLQELVDTTLQVMGLAALADQRDAALSPLHRSLFRVAAALLTRPGLLLVNPDVVDALDPDSVEILIKHLRKLAGHALTIVVITDKPPSSVQADGQVPIHRVEKPAGLTRHSILPVAPRRVSTSVTGIVLRLCLGPWRQLTGILPEALILPLILLPGLWFALPGHAPVLAAVMTMTIGAALATATLVSRGHRRLIPLARRHLIVGDVLLAYLLLGVTIALAQLGVVQLVLVVTSGISISTALALMPALLLVALSSVALGLLCGIMAGSRVLFAVLLTAALTLVQVMVVGWMDQPGDVGPIIRRLADLSGAFWGLALYQHDLPTANLLETLRAPAFLAGQIVLFLALARAVLRRRIQAA